MSVHPESRCLDLCAQIRPVLDEACGTGLWTVAQVAQAVDALGALNELEKHLVLIAEAGEVAAWEASSQDTSGE